MVGGISTARLKEVVEKGMRDIDSGPEMWETSFEDFEKEFLEYNRK